MSIFDLRGLPAGQVELHDARRRRRWVVPLEPFEIAVTPVTVAQHARVLGGSGSRLKLPVTDVSWLDAIEFCNASSAVEDLAPVYSVDEGEVVWSTDASGYRLPTEAEWEYACRAGTNGPQYGPLDIIAWTANDGVENPQEVGLKQPNDFGLQDTLGNVWEWCWDRLDPARYRDYRVFRGGGFSTQHEAQGWSASTDRERGTVAGMLPSGWTLAQSA